MSDLKAAADFFAREVARYAALKNAAEAFASAAAAEHYLQELQGRVDALTAELGEDGLRKRVVGLQSSISSLTSEHSTLLASVDRARSVHSDWETKNIAHAEAAKTWNGEADRVLKAAQESADEIVRLARLRGRAEADEQAAKVQQDAAAKAKAAADAYAAGRKSELSETEAKIAAAQANLTALETKLLGTKTKHEELKRDLAALRAKLG